MLHGAGALGKSRSQHSSSPAALARHVDELNLPKRKSPTMRILIECISLFLSALLLDGEDQKNSRALEKCSGTGIPAAN